MRSYLAMELMGAIWFMGAVLAHSEGLDRLWAFCCAVALSYFMRALLKYYSRKETANVAKNIDVTINVDSDGIISHSVRNERNRTAGRVHHVG
jgi:hypothetical protein